jgi:hypothetical protein
MQGTQIVKGSQSGGQVWDSAMVVRGRGPCNRGSIPGAHRTMFDSEMLPRRAAHAAGSRVWFYKRCPGSFGEPAEGESSSVAVTVGASPRTRKERHDRAAWWYSAYTLRSPLGQVRWVMSDEQWAMSNDRLGDARNKSRQSARSRRWRRCWV